MGNAGPTNLIDKDALKVNANYAVRMTDQGEGVRITPVHK